MTNEKRLKYTICFCIQENRILMLYRSFPPNQYKWNGLGGKLEEGETPEESVIREMKEEAEIDLTTALVRFAGVVLWNNTKDEHDKELKGMYAYIAYFKSENVLFPKKETREGTLEWKDIDWVLKKNNKDVVENISYFLPLMLTQKEKQTYQCFYVKDSLKEFTIHPFI